VGCLLYKQTFFYSQSGSNPPSLGLRLASHSGIDNLVYLLQGPFPILISWRCDWSELKSYTHHKPYSCGYQWTTLLVRCGNDDIYEYSLKSMEEITLIVAPELIMFSNVAFNLTLQAHLPGHPTSATLSSRSCPPWQHFLWSSPDTSQQYICNSTTVPADQMYSCPVRFVSPHRWKHGE